MRGKGVVVLLDGNKAKVRVTSESECMACSSRSHCFGGETRPREIAVINDFGAKVSDHVVFEADAGRVVISAALIWILPVLSMIVGYIVADRFAGGFWPVGSAFLFLAGAFFILRFIDKAVSGGKTFYPKISKIIDTPESCREFSSQ